MSYQASETRAEVLYSALDTPIVPATSNPFSDPIARVNTIDLTSGTAGGTGMFEILMSSMRSHLNLEFEKGRITGDQYAKAYIELSTVAMNTALQFVLGKDTAYWQTMLARYQAELVQGQFALIKMQLATEDAKFELTWKQVEIAHSQTSDTRIAGEVMGGTVLRQRTLLEEQRNAFLRDAEAKVAKMFLDAWVVQRTTDEGTPIPTALSNVDINEVMNILRFNVDMGVP